MRDSAGAIPYNGGMKEEPRGNQMQLSMYSDIIEGAKRLMTTMPVPMTILRPDGELLWANRLCGEGAGQGSALQEGTRIPIYTDEGEIAAYTVFPKGIRPERPDEERDEWYRIIAENTSDTIVLVDSESRVLFVSPSFCRMTGYRLDQYEGMDAFDIIHPDDRARVRAIHEKVMTDKTELDLGYRVIHANDHTLHIESRVKPVLGPDGRVRYVVAVARDVTKRKQTEELLENILDSVDAAVWSTDQQFTRYSFCSESIRKVTGIPRDEIMDRPIRLHDHIHPDDNVRLMGEVKQRLDEGGRVNQEIRLIHVPDEERWGQLIVQPSIGHQGAIERLDGILLDITEKKRSALALEESEQRYKSLFENNLDGVFSVELTGFYVVNANPVFEAITGMPSNRLYNRCLLGVVHDEDHPSVYEALHAVIRLRESQAIECRLAPLGREERIVSMTLVPIFLSGQLNGIHGIVKDITERKREERELVESEKRYKQLQQSLNRLSHDLANVMKVSELENRLLEEVRTVLKVDDASIVRVPRGEGLAPEDSGCSWIQIGENVHPVFLKIAQRGMLPRIEEEWLETAVHYVTILYDNLQFIEDLMKRLEENVASKETPRWMLRLLFQLSEKERATLSSDLHDTVLQDLIIWYRKLESLRSQREFDRETGQDLRQIEEGLLDAIHQIRITCNELRPPFLLKMGLVESLKSLFSYTRMFANYEIVFSADGFASPLNEEQILGLYRIVQELLNNANKHSRASLVQITLHEADDEIVFQYADDGVGLDLSAFGGSFQHMGLAGIEKRVMSLEGTIAFDSAPRRGFRVKVRFPKT